MDAITSRDPSAGGGGGAGGHARESGGVRGGGDAADRLIDRVDARPCAPHQSACVAALVCAPLHNLLVSFVLSSPLLQRYSALYLVTFAAEQHMSLASYVCKVRPQSLMPPLPCRSTRGRSGQSRQDRLEAEFEADRQRRDALSKSEARRQVRRLAGWHRRVAGPPATCPVVVQTAAHRGFAFFCITRGISRRGCAAILAVPTRRHARLRTLDKVNLAGG
jgi:hypothetical protein